MRCETLVAGPGNMTSGDQWSCRRCGHVSRVTVESDVSWPANTQHTGSHFLDTHVDAEINFIGKLINDKNI